MRQFSRLACAAFAAVVFITGSALAQERIRRGVPTEPPPSLWLEQLTTHEIDIALQQGYTNILIPTAGIEQNGHHLPLNKHHLVVRANAESIASTLGSTLIAPVIDFVPEGNIQSGEGHMAYPGTISIPRKVFADVLEYTARSLHHHGFKQIFFIGDSGGNQLAQAMMARSLQNAKIQAYHIAAYYAVDKQREELLNMGYGEDAVGGHAGLRETAELMAAAPESIRRDKLTILRQSDEKSVGAWGDVSLATPELGQRLLAIKTRAALTEICANAAQPPKGCVNLSQ